MFHRFQWRVHGALLVVQLLFGTWPVIGKIALRAMPGPALIGLRAGLATLLFVALGRMARLTVQQHVRVAAAGLLGITVNQLLFIGGLQRTGAVNSTVLATTIPVFTLALALLLRAEQPTRHRVLGMATALGGALFVTGAGRVQLGPDALQGNLMLLASTLSYAGYLVVTRSLSRELSPLALVPWIFFWGALFAAPVTVPSLVGAEIAWTPALVAIIAWVVLGPTVGTYYLNAVALRDAPPSLVAVFIYLQPVFSALAAYPVLGEVPSPAVLAGGGIIFIGVWIANRPAAVVAR
ncbi:MAG: DMT family transporter [Deltaproteobacteria bacterium]|nr:DMT family transporter [Deltaproteobacteria bacterium]